MLDDYQIPPGDVAVGQLDVLHRRPFLAAPSLGFWYTGAVPRVNSKTKHE